MYEELKITVVALGEEDIVRTSNGENEWNNPGGDVGSEWDDV